MSPVKQLYELQELETALTQSQKALADVESGLEETQALDLARQRVVEQKGTLESSRTEQRDLDLGLGTMESHVQDVEKKLYGGSVANPKELQGFQQDLRMLRRQKGEQEDHLLAVMEHTDGAEAAFKTAERDLEAAEAGWRQEHGHLLQEQVRLEQELARLGQGRDEASAGIAPSEMSLYQAQKSSKGTAISRVERGICQTCGLSIPSHELQRARTLPDLVKCNSCGRFLYVT